MMLMMIQIERAVSDGVLAFDYFMVHMEGAGASQSIPVVWLCNSASVSCSFLGKVAFMVWSDCEEYRERRARVRDW